MNNVYVGEKVVGVVEDGVFRKKVSAARHFLRKPPAIAFDLSSIEQAQEYGAQYIEVLDADSSRLYSAPIADLLSYGFMVNRGFGEQIALDLNLWDELEVAA